MAFDEISQGEFAGSERENWVRIEVEVLPVCGDCVGHYTGYNACMSPVLACDRCGRITSRKLVK